MKPALLALALLLSLLALAPAAEASSHACAGAVELRGTDHGLRAYSIRVSGVRCSTGKAVIRSLFRQMDRDPNCAADSANAGADAVGCLVGQWTCERPYRRGKTRGLCYHATEDREVRFLERDW